MADINVRLINGDSIVVHCPSDQINVKQLRLLLAQQKPNLASCQLFRNGSIVKGSLTVANLNLLPGEFLVALERKARETSESANHRHRQHDNASKNDSQTDLSNGAGNTGEEEPMPNSPTAGTLDSLLPGYLSRPQRSPQKPIRTLPPGIAPREPVLLPQETEDKGGFISSPTNGNQNNTRKQPPKTLLQLASAGGNGREQETEPQQQPQEERPTPSTVPSTSINPIASENVNTPTYSSQIPPLSQDAIASLPLPSTALLIESQFRSLCTFYEFFQRHHLQCTFNSLQKSMDNAGVNPQLTLEIVQLLNKLCPGVVHVTRHISASEQLENRTDDWRQVEEINRTKGSHSSDSVLEAGAAAEVGGGRDGGGGSSRAVEGPDARARLTATVIPAEDILISLVDPWEAKYDLHGSPPMKFLVEMHTFENQEVPIAKPLLEVPEDSFDPGTTLSAASPTSNTTTATASTRKRKKLSSNKPRRMAWLLRKSLANALIVLQEKYFGEHVPPVVHSTSELEKDKQKNNTSRNARRSKAGQQRQKEQQNQQTETPAEAEVVISLLEEDNNQPDDTTLSPVSKNESVIHDLLHQGKWHPLFPIENIVTLEALKETAEKILLMQSQQLDNGGGGGSASLDALDAVRNNASVEKHRSKPVLKKSRSNRPPAPPQLLKKHAPCTDTTSLSAPDFLKHLKSRAGYQDQIVHVEMIPARPATLAELDFQPSIQVQQALQHRNITTLYSHQTEAISHLSDGRHTVIATSTASGKSMCYAIPILKALVANPASCAVLIFPTKALAQDQRKNLHDMAVAAFGADTAPAVEIYDGDTPMDIRASIRDRAQLILTNPDMLHLSILPMHTQFSRILSNLKYVVVDEAHSYKGVFGCHTALVLRRLRRVCFRSYNTQPTFAITTATVANPAQHACTLLGVDTVVVVEKDGSPHGSKEFVLWNPPLKHPESAREKSAAAASRREEEEGNRETDMPSTSKVRNSSLVTRRTMQESGRAAVRAARQERNAGIMLGGPERGIEEKDWAAAVRAGQRDPVVKAKIASSSSPILGEKIMKRKTEEEAPPAPSAMLSISAAPAAEPQQQQQQQAPQQQLTSRQRALIAQATAAISLASGPYTNTSSLPRHNGADSGAGGTSLLRNTSSGLHHASGQRRVIKIGPETTKTTTTKTTHTTIESQDAIEPLPLNLSSKQASTQKLSAAAQARFGSAGVDMSSARTSPIVEIASLLAECVQHGLRTIAFCKTRKLSELVIAYVREILTVTAPELQTKVAVYRAGYSATERRQIEAALFSGALLGVAATNALELGVDIGGLDATLHLGFPGSIASLWQQAGRAGRSQQPSISIYVGWDGPLDQFFFKSPEKLFSRPIEAAMVDVSNPAALQAHAACAAYEVLIDPELDSTYYFGPSFPAVVATLQNKGILGRNFCYTGNLNNPASAITLRAIDPGKFSIIDETASNGAGQVLEEVEEAKVFYQVHDGSTYFFQGRTYLCRKLDLDAKVALVRPVDVKYYTKSVDYTAVQVMGGGESAFPAPQHRQNQPENGLDSTTTPSFLPTSALASAATVTTRWLGFVRIWRGTGEVFDSVDLFLPDVEYETEAAYLRLPPTARRKVEAAGLPFRDGVHAAAHAVLNALPLCLMANPEDVGTECDNPYDTRYKPERILIYDKHPGGGIGLAKAASYRFTELLQRALALISNCSCSCSSGCPGCIQHTACGEYNAVLHKEAGRLILEAALEAEAEKYGLDKTALVAAEEEKQQQMNEKNSC